MITLYDIPSNNPGTTWSPNTRKARIALLYKGLSFKTEWVEYPDIEAKLKELGAAPTGKWGDGRDEYTLPVIHDPSTGRFVSDSIRIAEYLDDIYPDKPTLFPHGIRAPAHLFDEYFFPTAVLPIGTIMLSKVATTLHPRSAEYFIPTRKLKFGMDLTKDPSPGPARDSAWQAAEQGWTKVAKLYKENGDGKMPFFYGSAFSYADVVVLAFLTWMRLILGENSKEWKAVETWDEGRWGKMMELTKGYQVGEI